jgi:predicted nuclease of restriction endonuclease-like (RecB) superfamily
VGTLSPQLQSLLPADYQAVVKVGTMSPKLSLPANKLLRNLAYSHFELLLEITNPLKRAFYELECIKGNWSVRELKRQINSLFYERTGLSLDKTALEKMTQAIAEPNNPKLVIRDPYVFEFLGIKSEEVMHESDLEKALLDKLQEFLLELGRGFCFEARQKRLLIGGEHFFVDLVFYHRILKCHVLIDLKLKGFEHAHLSQLNSYVGYYRENELTAGDNPPVGLLLCTAKNHALVKYALAGLDNQLFVSKYLLQLPDQAEMQRFLERQMQEMAEGPTKHTCLRRKREIGRGRQAKHTKYTKGRSLKTLKS